jgi:propionyl-CoA carboxylase beta chain
MHLAGCLDIDASEKAARFVRTCDAFSIPILTFVDVPGFLPGVSQEWRGIIRRGAKLIYAYAEATVPEGDGDHQEGVRRRLRRDGLQAPGRRRQPGLAHRADRGDGRAGGGEHPVPPRARRRRDPDALRAQRITEYEDTLANPYIAAERGYVDAVIRPAETRLAVTRALRALRTKRQTLPPKKHGNIPL